MTDKEASCDKGTCGCSCGSGVQGVSLKIYDQGAPAAKDAAGCEGGKGGDKSGKDGKDGKDGEGKSSSSKGSENETVTALKKIVKHLDSGGHVTAEDGGKKKKK